MSAETNRRCVSVLNASLAKLLEERSDVLLIGEDLDDPYGGAFKVTQGLSTRFPDQVVCTPISESAMFGVACGLALRGFRPVVEVMFGDFLTLAMDQIVNHISPFQDTCAETTALPLVVRAPMGGGRGYGPTHSKSLERLLLGVPNIVVVAASQHHDIGGMLETAVACDQPVFMIENKQMYAQFNERPVQGRLGPFHCRQGTGPYPALTLSTNRFGAAAWTIATYAGGVPLAIQAMRTLLLEHEMPCELVIVGSLQPLDVDPVLESVERTRGLITLEEGVATAGVGAELAARVTAAAWGQLRESPRRIGALPASIAAAPALEKYVLPAASDVVDAALGLAGRWKNHNG
jgi:pyruvate/2-oxoglutarate/acetoin dehydrogenase E1 component